MSVIPFNPRIQPGRSEAGTSLVETLIAAGILLVIAVSIFPMFHRAVANNISGADSSQATQHGRSQLEGLFSLPFDSVTFDMRNPQPGHQVDPDGSGHRMTIEDLYWDDQANAGAPSATDRTQHLAPGAWVADRSTAVGHVVWRRVSVIRQYSYADIGSGVIDVTGSGQLAGGDRYAFDNPLPSDTPDSLINFREQDVTMNSHRTGLPSLRNRFVRTF